MAEEEMTNGPLKAESDLIEETAADKSARLGSSHGEAGKWVEKSGYARDINAIAEPGGSSEAVRGGAALKSRHPSRNLTARAKGFGIGGGQCAQHEGRFGAGERASALGQLHGTRTVATLRLRAGGQQPG